MSGHSLVSLFFQLFVNSSGNARASGGECRLFSFEASHTQADSLNSISVFGNARWRDVSKFCDCWTMFFELFPVVLRNVAIKNRRPALGGRLAIPTGDFLVTRIHESHPRFVFHLDGTLASPLPGCRVHNGQLLMLTRTQQPFSEMSTTSTKRYCPKLWRILKQLLKR